MKIKGLQPKTLTMYLRGVRDFKGFWGRSPNTATPEDLQAFQLDMKERGRWGADIQQPADGAEPRLRCDLSPTRDEAHMRYQRAAKNWAAFSQ